ncbi:MAG: hypothetical protein WD846_03870 [Patescibacteria group bacterium]
MQRKDNGSPTGMSPTVVIVGIVCLVVALIAITAGAEDRYGTPHDPTPPSQTR